MVKSQSVAHVSRLKLYLQDDLQIEVEIVIDRDSTVEQAVESTIGYIGVKRNREYLVHLYDTLKKSSMDDKRWSQEYKRSRQNLWGEDQRSSQTGPYSESSGECNKVDPGQEWVLHTVQRRVHCTAWKARKYCSWNEHATDTHGHLELRGPIYST